MVDMVNAGNELRMSLMICSHLLPQVSIQPVQFAVLAGLAVRLYKLYDSYMYLIADHRLEIALILGRSACDTVIDLTYLCATSSEEEYNKFLKSSLATGKKIHDEVDSDRNAGCGHPAIQSRIQSSIQEDFDAAGISLEDVAASDWRLFGTAARRADSVGLDRAYLFIYKNLSRLTHGSWSELVKYHLMREEEQWYPNAKYEVPRPAAIDGISILVVEGAKQYAERISPGCDLIERLDEIANWFRSIAHKHEQFQSEQSGQ